MRRILEARKEGREKIQEIKTAAYEQEKGMLQAAVDQAGEAGTGHADDDSN